MIDMTEQFNPKVLFDNVDFLIKSENRKLVRLKVMQVSAPDIYLELARTVEVGQVLISL